MMRQDLGRFMYAWKPPERDFWYIHNKRSDAPLGGVEWYAPWKTHVFESIGEGAIFSADCLQEIVKFLGRLNKERKESDGANVR